MCPELHILNVSIPMYPLCVAIGFLIANILLNKLSSSILLNEKQIFSLMCFIEVGVIIGGKLLFLIINFHQLGFIFQKFGIMGVITKTGFVFYGALIFGVLSCFIFIKIYEIKMSIVFPVAFLITPLIHAFGRLGCFCANCCYGIKYDGFASINIQGVNRFPIQLFEAFWNFIIFLFLLFLLKKNKKLIIQCYLISYGILRLITEQLRGDFERGFIGKMSVSSYISLFLILLGIIYHIIQQKTYNYKKG